MGAKTGIEWTDATVNPIRARHRATGKLGWHCEHASPGCINCYAETFNHRLGTGLPFRPDQAADIEMLISEDALLAPLRWRRPRRIFWCSMTDLFGAFVPFATIDRCIAVMALAGQHTHQVLTKRSDRMFEYMTTPDRKRKIAECVMDISEMLARHGRQRVKLDAFSAVFAGEGPFTNVWLGVSVEDQRRAEERIPHLLATPAAVRFLSCEPLLESVDLREIYHGEMITDALGGMSEWPVIELPDRMVAINPSYRSHARLDWIIIGGESGPRARDMDPAWARSLRDQCAYARVPCFVKQMAHKAPIPDDLRVRQFPGDKP